MPNYSAVIVMSHPICNLMNKLGVFQGSNEEIHDSASKSCLWFIEDSGKTFLLDLTE
jgi:hypothetical protein